ncbi:MAG: hypothetical protein Q9157_002155 [Trypethelium eluteriae]
MRLADLSDPDMCRYNALSYVWGPPDMSETITINQQLFRVSVTLSQALHQIRHSENARVVWIDALCINQDDFNERSSQVLLMQHIYSRATSVIVWLGEKAPWGLSRALRDTKQDGDAKKDTVFSKGAVRYGVSGVISKLLQRPWWKRVWIVQELVLAQKVKFYCGTHRIEWDHFCFLVGQSASRPYFQRENTFIEEFYAMKADREERLRCVTNPIHNTDRSWAVARDRCARSYESLALIYNFRNRKASEPRDRVFAFQGLAAGQNATSINGISPQHSNFLVFPNYSRHEAFLSIDFARAHICEWKTLSIVALAECARKRDPQQPDTNNDHRKQYIPSWCLAFMNEQAIQEGMHWRPYWTGLPLSRGLHFAAANKLPVQTSLLGLENIHPSPEHDEEVAATCGYPSKLPAHTLPNFQARIIAVGHAAGVSTRGLAEVTGKVLTGRESTISPSFQSRLSWDAVLPSWQKPAAKYPRCQVVSKPNTQICKETSPDNVSTDELFQLTLTAGRFKTLPHPVWRPARASVLSRPNDEMKAYLKSREDACAGRRFFVTSDGHFGLGPADLQVNDEIHIMLGLQVPAVLRKASEVSEKNSWGVQNIDDDHFLYVGQAYVHQLMIYRWNLGDDIQSGMVELKKIFLV